MSLKKKLGLGVASAALGLSLVGGGTYAYFSTTATQTSTFASGTLNLAVDPVTNVPLTNLKPGDWSIKTFDLINTGTLDIKKVSLKTDYTVTKNNGDTVSPAIVDKYSDAIIVDFLVNRGDNLPANTVLLSKPLKELKGMTPDDLAKEWDKAGSVYGIPYYVMNDGIKAGTGSESTDNFVVKFRFKDSGADDQNDLQDLKLNLTWKFIGVQENGTQR